MRAARRVSNGMQGSFWLKFGVIVAAAGGAGIGILRYCGLQLDWNGGVWSEVRAWERNGSFVYVIPMIHVGEKRFYDEVAEVCRGSIVMLEGIDSTPLPAPLRLFVWLAHQMILLAAVIFTNVFVDVGSLISRIDPTPRRTIVNQENFFTPSVFCSSLPIMSDVHISSSASLITGRNNHLFKVFDCIPRQPFFPISIPWGAAHSPGISSALIERGYSPVGVRYIRIGYASELIMHMQRIARSKFQQQQQGVFAL